MKPKQVKLQHYKTGRIIQAEGISEFCRIAKLGGNAKFHFNDVLKGKRFHHKGWHLPRQDQAIICDVTGKIHEVTNILVFAKKMGVNLTKVDQLINCEIPNYNGLYLEGANPPPHKIRKKYRFVLSNGTRRVQGFNASEIAGKIGIAKSGMYQLTSGRRSEVAGWKISKVEEINDTGLEYNE